MPGFKALSAGATLQNYVFEQQRIERFGFDPERSSNLAAAPRCESVEIPVRMVALRRD